MKKSFIPFIGYLACFYLAWTFVWVHGVYPWATRTIGDATLSYALINIVFRLLIWVLPVFGYGAAGRLGSLGGAGARRARGRSLPVVRDQDLHHLG